jgi:6-phosphofructokinase 1
MRTLGILTNGGDTCSLNAVIKSVRDNGIDAGYTRILGIQDGYSGIADFKVRLLTWEPVDAHRGGTILRSQRYAPRSDEEKKQFLANLQELEIDALIIIGGDGTLSAARELLDGLGGQAQKVRVLGFPRTIDNDIRTNTFDDGREVALCPGYPSAASKVAQLTRELRTTAMSSSKIFVLEIMGRDAGWLAAAASLGGAEFNLIPEVELLGEQWESFYDRVLKLYSIHGHGIIAVSEGFRINGQQKLDAAFGPRKLGGIGIAVAKRVEHALIERGRHIDVRYQQAGYIPRMGSPTAYDIRLADALGLEIGKMLKDGVTAEIPVPSRVSDSEGLSFDIERMPFRDVSQYFLPDQVFYDRERFCVNESFIGFLDKIIQNGP